MTEKPRLEDLLAAVPPAALDTPSSDDHLMELALGLSDWRVVALYLRLEDGEMTDIEERGKSVLEKSVMMLRKWRQKFGEHATYRSLAGVLWRLDRTDMVEKICELLSTAPPPAIPDDAVTTSCHGSPPPAVCDVSLNENVLSKRDNNEEEADGDDLSEEGGSEEEVDKDSLSNGGDTDEEAEAVRMPEAHREILVDYTGYLSERMVPEKVVDGLQKLEVFDCLDKEMILAKVTTREKNEKLIEILLTRGTHAFTRFIQALRRIHPSLAEELRLKIYPVKCRVLWLAENASHAAVVVHTLEKPECAGVRFDDEIMRAPGCLFRHGLVSGHETRRGMEQVEIIVVFPVHESLLPQAIKSAFAVVCPQADIAVMCGVCKVGGEGVKSGEIIMVTQAVEDSQIVPWNSVGPKVEFVEVLRSHLQQLFRDTPAWLSDGKFNQSERGLNAVPNANSTNQKEASMQFQTLWLTRLYLELQKVQDSRWLYFQGWDLSLPSLLNQHNQALVDRKCCDWKDGNLVASLLKEKSWYIDASSPLGVTPNQVLITQVEEQLASDPDYPPPPPDNPIDMPHFGAIETLSDTSVRNHDDILGSDANSFTFYSLCNSELGPDKPWFVCKGVPHGSSETGCVVTTTCLLVEAMEVFVMEMDATTT